MILNNYDLWPLWIIYFSLIALLFMSAEIGYYLGTKRNSKVSESTGEDKQTGSIMGASLGLLAFLLAFSFNIATNNHAERKTLVLKEANTIGTFYLRTHLFDLSQAAQIRKLLQDYVQLRIAGTNLPTNEDFDKRIKDSEKILDEIWLLVTEIAEIKEPTPILAQLISSANETIDLHSERVNAGLKRLPIASNFILVIIAMLTLALMGYQSGLNGARVLIPRSALIFSLSTVMILVTDLDRPGGELISVSQHALVELQKQISE